MLSSFFHCFPPYTLALHSDPPSLLLSLFIYLISSLKRLVKFRASVEMKNNVIRETFYMLEVC